MAERYGLSADEVYSLMSRGRFRVKANVDQATADRYVRELEALGARVQIEAARTGRPSLPPPERAAVGGSGAARSASRSTKPPPLTPSGEPPHGLLVPLREEVRDRAADPDARGPRQRIGPSISSAPSPLRDAATGPADDAGEGLVLHRASWPRTPPSGAPNPGSTLPPPLASRLPASGLPPQPASRPNRPSLPPQHASRPIPTALPRTASRPIPTALPRTASRPIPTVLPSHVASRPAPASLPPDVASRPARSSLASHVVPRATPGSLPPQDAVPRSALASTSSDEEPDYVETSSLDVAGLDDSPIQLGALDRSGLLALATLDEDPRSGPASSPSADPSAPTAGELGDIMLGVADDELERRTTQRTAMSDEVTVQRTSRSSGAVPAVRRSWSSLEAGPPGSPSLMQDGSLHAPGALSSVEAGTSSPTQRGSLHGPGSPSSMQAGMSSMQAGLPSSTGASVHAPGSPLLIEGDSLYASSRQPIGAGAWGAATAGTSGAPTSPLLAPTQRRASPAPRTRLATHARLAASPRVRLAAGVVLAIVLGFLPAHIAASLGEDSAFRPIDTRVIAAHAAVDSQASYDALDAIRAEQLEAKRSARNTIALTSMLIWAAASGAIAYAWFRRRPDRF